MNIEKVEELMNETAEAVAYQNVIFILIIIIYMNKKNYKFNKWILIIHFKLILIIIFNNNKNKLLGNFWIIKWSSYCWRWRSYWKWISSTSRRRSKLQPYKSLLIFY